MPEAARRCFAVGAERASVSCSMQAETCKGVADVGGEDLKEVRLRLKSGGGDERGKRHQ